GSSLKPLEEPRRHSNPPLKACFPTVQLKSSPAVVMGLSPSRQRAGPPMFTKDDHRVGFTWNGIPLALATYFLASSPIASPRSADPHCQLFDAFFPARNSLSRLGDSVDVSWIV